MQLTCREVVDGFGHRRLALVNKHRNVFRNDEDIIVSQFVGIHATISVQHLRAANQTQPEQQ
jgi:hypothetical protein